MIQPAFEILNQRGTPMFFSDVFANRPTAGIVGRIFISTDTYAFYRDTGSGWDLIGGPGSGTITGSGTSGYIPLFTGSSSIGNSALQQGGGLIYTTNDLRADAFYLTDMSTGNGALWTSGNDLSLANYNPTGKVNIQAGGGGYAIEVASNLNTTFFGNIIRNGGLSTQFLKADGSLDSSTYVTTNIYNSNGTLSGNRVVSLNSNYLSFAGGQTYIGSQTASSGLLTINNASADAHLQVVGASAPSIRIDNAGSGATQRLVLGLATATNNFIQGSTAGDICISTASASPLLFGMWQTINASEVMRISTSNNLLVGTSVDSGEKLIVSGNTKFTGVSYFNRGTLQVTLNPSYGSGNVYSQLQSTASLALASGGDNNRFYIKNDGNIGMGIVPSSWSNSNNLEFNIYVNISSQGTYGGTINNNAYYDNGWKYMVANYATQYQTLGGEHRWLNAGVGAGAGNPISFVQAMTLNSSGNLGIGSSTPNVRLQIVQSSNNDGIRIVSSNATTQNTLQFYHDDTKAVIETTYLGSGAFKPLCLNTQGANVLIGTTTDGGYKLRVNGAIFSDDYIQANNNITAKGTFQGFGPASGSGVFLSYEPYGGRLESYDYGTQSYKNINISPNGGNVTIGSSATVTQKLYLNGSLRIDGQLSATAGGSSGQHLIINCDGTTYKIALLNN